MSDMNFGVNVLPTTTETYNLGSDTKKWNNVYAETLNGKDVASLGTVQRYSVTIPTTGWTQATGSLNSVTVTVQGIQSTDDCAMVVLVQTGTESTDSELRTAYASITRIAAGTNSITAYATAVPSVAIPIRIALMR